MCLKIFCDDDLKFKKLEENACSLGSAFQKINFLRDIKSDYEERGRVYFPNIDFKTLGKREKRQIEKDIEKEFDHALIGIKNLPSVARPGVYLSYKYYRELLNKIKKLDHNKIKTERIRVSSFKKFMIFVSSYLNPV